MAGAKLERTSTSGIFKREGERGTRYVVIHRDTHGKQRRETARTLEDARKLKSRRELGDTNPAGRLTFGEYAREWVQTHPLRESSRADYVGHLERRIIPFIGDKRRLADVTPLLIRQFVDHLQRASGPRRKPLAHSSVHAVLSPLRACLRQAVADGLIQHNPARDIRVRKPDVIAEDAEHDVRVLNPEQLATFLAVLPDRHRLMFRFLSVTGLRASELFALQWRHLQLDGNAAHVKVRQAYVRGMFHPPKSKHGLRDVPLPASLVSELRAWRKATEWPRDVDIVFPG